MDREKAAEFQVDKAPAIVVMNGKDYGIRYYGIPSGYEFGSLINVMAVPRVVINEDHYFEGALPEAAFLAATLQALDPQAQTDELEAL